MLSNLCPICEGPMHPEQVMNALSRADNKTYICSDCGAREGLTDFFKRMRG